MWKIRSLMMMVLFVVTVTSCNNSTNPDSSDADDYNAGEFNQGVEQAIAKNTGHHEDADDYTWDTSGEVQITLNETSITVNGNGASVKGNVVTITSAGNYNISGKMSNGQIVVDTEDNDNIRLILNNADITYSTSAPINIVNAEKTILILADSTENFLTDGSTYVLANAEEDEPNAALFSKGDLSIYGNGRLTIDANYNDGISSKDGLIIKSGNLIINAIDDGIRGKDYLVIRDGRISVTAGGDGLKSDNDEDETMGYVWIDQGEINLISKGDGIDAATDALISHGTLTLKTGGGSSYTVSGDASAKGLKGTVCLIIDDGTITANCADDALHSNSSVVINNGIINISTGDDAIHGDQSVIINEGTVTVTKSVEGVESNYITVSGGILNILASDDCFNSTAGSRTEADDKSCTYIYGGYLVLQVTKGDGLDSNGSIVMQGGTVIIHGPSSQPEVMFDYNGTFNISGGLLVASGSSSNMTQAPSSGSSQYSLKIMLRSSRSASTLFHIEDSDGNDVLTFAPIHSYQSIGYSSPDLVKGKSYNVFIGGSSTGENKDGVYTGGSYSGGTQKTNFTLTGKSQTVQF